MSHRFETYLVWSLDLLFMAKNNFLLQMDRKDWEEMKVNMGVEN